MLMGTHLLMLVQLIAPKVEPVRYRRRHKIIRIIRRPTVTDPLEHSIFPDVPVVMYKVRNTTGIDTFDVRWNAMSGQPQ